MRKRLKILLGLSSLMMVSPTLASAQDLGSFLRKKVEAEVKRQIEQPRKSDTPPPGDNRPARAAANTTTSPGGPAGTSGPSATVKRSSAPLGQWLRVSQGVKFGDSYNCSDGIESVAFRSCNRPQILTTNPYYSDTLFLFATMSGIDCRADGSLVIGGEGWENGDITTSGWWKVAPDGAVTPLYTSPYGAKTSLPLGKAYFRIAKDDSLVVASRGAVYRIRDGRTTLIAGQDAVDGASDGMGAMATFKNLGVPAIDDQGNIWVPDQGACTLRRITPDGMVSTVIGKDRSACGERPVGERVVLSNVAWDAVNGELVMAGSTIVGKPTHDMHVSIWRMKPGGEPRRVYYTVKAGRSPIGQNMDHLWAVSVDGQGRIIVGTQPIPSSYGRRLMRLDEKTGKLISVTSGTMSDADIIPGREDGPYDGPAQRSAFRKIERICQGANGTTFVLDEHLVRRVEAAGTVSSWVY